MLKVVPEGGAASKRRNRCNRCRRGDPENRCPFPCNPKWVPELEHRVCCKEDREAEPQPAGMFLRRQPLLELRVVQLFTEEL